MNGHSVDWREVPASAEKDISGRRYAEWAADAMEDARYDPPHLEAHNASMLVVIANALTAIALALTDTDGAKTEGTSND